MTLAVTIGSWVLDFALAGQPGLAEWLYRLSLTQTLRPFEQGLLSLGLVLGILAVVAGLAALACVWLHPGVTVAGKLTRSLGCVVAASAPSFAAQIRTEIDYTEDRRNSFPAADQRAFAALREPLVITVHLAPEDPRYVDLRRNVLSKLERALPNVTIRLPASSRTIIGRSNDDAYGEVEYTYGGRTDRSRSTSHREILPLLYGLAGIPVPAPVIGEDYPGTRWSRTRRRRCRCFFGALPGADRPALAVELPRARTQLRSVKAGGKP